MKKSFKKELKEFEKGTKSPEGIVCNFVNSMLLENNWMAESYRQKITIIFYNWYHCNGNIWKWSHRKSFNIPTIFVSIGIWYSGWSGGVVCRQSTVSISRMKAESSTLTPIVPQIYNT